VLCYRQTLGKPLLLPQTLSSQHVCNRGGFFCLQIRELSGLGILVGVSPSASRPSLNISVSPSGSTESDTAYLESLCDDSIF
jgi:hypothetical protein